ncbi:MAG: CBS domain-containing protein [Thermodesulfovibrionales bacterium]|nr:CBS domain-containing protein [Thermodesulfovibrionales bacterium]
MIVRQIMKKDLVTVPLTASVHDAALRMKENNIGTVLVTDEKGKLKGILTDRDIALAVAGDARDPKFTCVCDIMTPDPITIDPDADLDSAIRIMQKARIRRIPVTENGKLIGFISADDVAAAFKEQFDLFMELESAYAKH